MTKKTTSWETTRSVVVIDSVRSAVAKAMRGSLKDVHPVQFGSQVLKGLFARQPDLQLGELQDLIVGCAMPEAEQGWNMAQLIAQNSGLHDNISGVTINRLCSSGLQSIAMAHQAIAFGQADVMVAGGVESMSLIPMGGHHILPEAQLAENFPDAYLGMGLTAERVAQKYKISREEQDEFALTSHQRAVRAQAEGKFDGELVDLTLNNGSTFNRDEGPRADTSIEALAKLKPAFSMKGTVTAGNSSQVSDGAAFTLLASESYAEKKGLQPIAKLVGFATAGVPAGVMGIGPIKAIPKVLEMTGLTLADIDLIELNEAFASQSIAVIRELQLDSERVNVNGGAIALGHPLGCTGAKLSATLLSELRRRNGQYGMVSMCVGGGMGAAGIFELI
jgi:acetyl-CoA acyltransferase